MRPVLDLTCNSTAHGAPQNLMLEASTPWTSSVAYICGQTLVVDVRSDAALDAHLQWGSSPAHLDGPYDCWPLQAFISHRLSCSVKGSFVQLCLTASTNTREPVKLASFVLDQPRPVEDVALHVEGPNGQPFAARADAEGKLLVAHTALDPAKDGVEIYGRTSVGGRHMPLALDAAGRLDSRPLTAEKDTITITGTVSLDDQLMLESTAQKLLRAVELLVEQQRAADKVMGSRVDDLSEVVVRMAQAQKQLLDLFSAKK
jgi:hypothetical protein